MSNVSFEPQRLHILANTVVRLDFENHCAPAHILAILVRDISVGGAPGETLEPVIDLPLGTLSNVPEHSQFAMNGVLVVRKSRPRKG